MNRNEYACLAMQVARLQRERSYELCVKVAEALGYSLVEESGSVRLDAPDSQLLSVYFQVDALVDDLLASAKQALGWR